MTDGKVLDPLQEESFSSPFDRQNRRQSRALFRSMRKRDIWATCLILFGSTYGNNSQSLPGTMVKVGPFAWFVLLGISLAINFIVLEHLIDFAETRGLRNFVDLSKIIGNRKTYTCILIFFVLSSGFRLLIAVTFINELICGIFASYDFTFVLISVKQSLFWILVPIVLLFPLIIKRKLKSLAISTFISLTAAVFLVIFITYNYFTDESKGNKNKSLSKEYYKNIPEV
jgi:hypothetical protein